MQVLVSAMLRYIQQSEPHLSSALGLHILSPPTLNIPCLV